MELRRITGRKKIRDEPGQTPDSWKGEKGPQSLLNLFSSPAAVIDENGCFLEVNDRLVEVTGFAEQEMLRKNLLNTEIFTPQSRAILRDALSKGAPGFSIRTNKIVLLTKDGEKLTTETDAKEIEYNEKNAILVTFHGLRERAQVLARMVGERTKDLRKSEEKLRSIFDSSPDAIIVTDLNGTITECNQAALDLHHSPSKDEIIGRNIAELIVKKDRKRVMEDLKKTPREGSARSLEYVFLTEEGHEFPVELSASVVQDLSGDLTSFVVEIKDITERKRMEEELRQYSEHLEKLVEEKTRMLREAERMAAIGELAAMVGHDLRNPLTGIAGAAYYIRTKLRSKIDSETVQMLEIIENDVQRSNKIINDLLDYSTEIRLELEEITPRAIVAKALSFVKIPKKIHVSNLSQKEPRVVVDTEKMMRAFINIIKNAVDAMPDGGRLTIRTGETNNIMKFFFTDTGMGVPREIREKLWKPLVTTKAQGMGFGLAICKRMVDAHGGSISLKSAIGKGTTVTVAVPTIKRLNNSK